jgi:riboflavin kinase/FMN adenylyltransferase
MKIIRHLSYETKLSEVALAIGNFDGVHNGHRKIIDEVKKISANKCCSAILIFEPHPASFFRSVKNFRITTLSKKLEIFRDLGIDYVIIMPFNRYLSGLEADEFIAKILTKFLKIQHLIVGYDFVFGKNRGGNSELLRNFFNTRNISALESDGKICSSSLIRELIRGGKIEQANKLLGRNFSIEGFVAEGRKLAREIGFPTINIKAMKDIVNPKFGVYKVNIFLKHLQKTFSGIMNFGLKPTIGDSVYPLYEAHIFDFDEKKYGSLYEKKVEIELVDFIREEKKFSGLNELKNQIILDVKIAKF